MPVYTAKVNSGVICGIVCNVDVMSKCKLRALPRSSTYAGYVQPDWKLPLSAKHAEIQLMVKCHGCRCTCNLKAPKVGVVGMTRYNQR